MPTLQIRELNHREVKVSYSSDTASWRFWLLFKFQITTVKFSYLELHISESFLMQTNHLNNTVSFSGVKHGDNIVAHGLGLSLEEDASTGAEARAAAPLGPQPSSSSASLRISRWNRDEDGQREPKQRRVRDAFTSSGVFLPGLGGASLRAELESPVLLWSLKHSQSSLAWGCLAVVATCMQLYGAVI